MSALPNVLAPCRHHYAPQERMPRSGWRGFWRSWLRRSLYVLLLTSPYALAWSDHGSINWLLFEASPYIDPAPVKVERLSTFLAAQQAEIAATLRAQDACPGASPGYAAPTTPGASPGEAEARDYVGAFIRCIRVNPEYTFALYTRQLTADSPGDGARLSWSVVSTLPKGEEGLATFIARGEGDYVAPLLVLASASDEPDYGMDVGLFTDNGTPWGEDYGFGPQPFGNPQLVYGSQAPFHMGFYHLDLVTRTLQPQLLQTYPEQRVALYRALAQTAFSTGHPYWGWRFLGWALHYVGDLSQPYHAVPLPGVSLPVALWHVLTGQTANLVQRVSNRHGVLESYQLQRLRTLACGGTHRDLEAPSVLCHALTAPDSMIRFTSETLREQISADSAAAAASLDRVLSTWMPNNWLDDPNFEWVGSGEEVMIIEKIRGDRGEDAINALDRALAIQLARLARYSIGLIATDAPQTPERSETVRPAQ